MEETRVGDPIFEPLDFPNLRLKNRVVRSSISGRFDNYDGSGNQTRINWELKFARGGVAAIVSALAPIEPRAFNVPNYAFIDRDDTIPFWRRLGEEVHEHDCRYIVQLFHAGRQRDVRGFQQAPALSSTDKPEPVHGLTCERMTIAQIQHTVGLFGQAARRAREAGLDGVEVHGANGYLVTQFLSSAINDRVDEYGGPLENRARFLLEVVRRIREEVGADFHVQVKISATEYANTVYPWSKKGNTIEDSVQVARWLEEAGADAIHVSTGSSFPHPRNPPGEFPVADAVKTYHTMLGSGKYTLRNYLMFRTPPAARAFQWSWERQSPKNYEGMVLSDSRAIKSAVTIPVICTGGFQTASVIRNAIGDRSCDAVSIARPLVANNDLVEMFRAGRDRAPRPCSYCNRCLFNALENPLGCYDERRYPSREAMVEEILSVYDPPPFNDAERPAEQVDATR